MKTDVINARKRYRENTPQKFRGQYDRATKGRSRSMAIRSFCLSCMGYSPNEVEKCTSLGCPLYKWRFGNENRGRR